jgi:hypothetical protein
MNVKNKHEYYMETYEKEMRYKHVLELPLHGNIGK